ncbi:MAG TPA: hypothetical protein VN922_19585 [Bacteroidia bacterium]|nr:hypothetical protein [Bacteroidia bacterium]
MVREYKWPPENIGGFFIDDLDEFGIVFWYEDVKEIIEDLKPKKD